MKKLTGLVIILVALILGGYYGMGILTEKTIRKNVEAINQSKGLHADIEQYDRGLFTSQAQVKWNLHIPERVTKDANGQTQTLPAQDYTTEMPLAVYHGPVIFHKNVQFGLGYAEALFPFPPQYYSQFDAQFTKESTKPQLNLNIFINYLNHSKLNFKVPAFNLITKEDNSQLQWLGFNAKTSMSPQMKEIQGEVVLDGLNVNSTDTTITLKKVTSDYNLHETDAGLYLGTANFSLPSFDVFVKNQKMFELSSLVLQSDSDIKDHLFSTSFTITLKSVLANGQNYGPGVLELALRNLDADILAKINQQSAAMQNGTDIQRQQAMIALLPELPKLFAKGAEFEISKFSLKIPQGQIAGNLFVSLPKGENTNPFELMQKVEGKAQLRVPTAALKLALHHSVMQQLSSQPALQQTLMEKLQPTQAPGQTDAQPAMTQDQIATMQVDNQLSAMQKNGLIKTQGTDSVIDVSLKQGKFLVNEKPFDAGMLKF